MFERIVFYSGLLSLTCAAVIVFGVVWATARDALRRRMRLHKLRVMYSRAEVTYSADHEDERGPLWHLAEVQVADQFGLLPPHWIGQDAEIRSLPACDE